MIEFEERPEDLRIPRPLLWTAAVLVLAVVLMAGVARRTDAGALRMDVPAAEEVAARRDLVFTDREDGAVVVTDVRTRATVHVVEPGVNSFIRGALRGLAYERRKQGVGREVPFTLTRWADGRLTLADPVTGILLDLAAYGPANRDAFGALLPAARREVSVNPT